MDVSYFAKRGIAIDIRIVFLLQRIPMSLPNRREKVMQILKAMISMNENEIISAKNTVNLLQYDRISTLESQNFDQELVEVSKRWNEGVTPKCACEYQVSIFRGQLHILSM